jgi:hypothetical protein
MQRHIAQLSHRWAEIKRSPDLFGDVDIGLVLFRFRGSFLSPGAEGSGNMQSALVELVHDVELIGEWKEKLELRFNDYVFGVGARGRLVNSARESYLAGSNRRLDC